MRNTILLLISAVFLSSCAKDDSLGNHGAKVQVLISEYGGGSSSPEGVHVFIKKSGSGEYLFEKVTNDEGIVAFDLLKEGTTYVAYSSHEIDNITYSDSVVFTINKDKGMNEFTLRMDFNNSFNLYKIHCVDNLGAPLPNVDVCLFQSSYLADSAYCSASTYSQTSGSKGIVNFWNSEEGTYYIGIRDTIGGIPVYHTETILIPNSGVVIDTLTLIP